MSSLDYGADLVYNGDIKQKGKNKLRWQILGKANKTKKIVIIIIAVAVVIAVALTLVFVLRNKNGGSESSGNTSASESVGESETKSESETDSESESETESENPYIDVDIDPSLIKIDDGTLIVDNDKMCGNLVIPSKIGDTEITYLSQFSFKACRNLISVSLPETVVQIDRYAFIMCKELRSVTMYPGVETIGKRAFDGCPKIEKIIFKGTKAQWNAIEKGDRWIDKKANFVVLCTDGTIENPNI